MHNCPCVTIYFFSDEDVRLWLVSELKALCCWTPPQEEDETRRVQQKVMSSKNTDISLIVAMLHTNTHTHTILDL